MVWLEKGMMDADGPGVIKVPCKLISNTLSVRGQLKRSPRRNVTQSSGI